MLTIYKSVYRETKEPKWYASSRNQFDGGRKPRLKTQGYWKDTTI